MLVNQGEEAIAPGNNFVKSTKRYQERQSERQGIPLGARAVTDGATFDGETLYPHVEKLFEKEKFIYRSPKDVDNVPVCCACHHREICCPNATTGRTINISFDLLPHIDPQDHPMSKRYKAIMSRRPSVERMIKRLKCDLGDDRLTKKGNDSFQAYLDKTMIVFHLLLRY